MTTTTPPTSTAAISPLIAHLNRIAATQMRVAKATVRQAATNHLG